MTNHRIQNKKNLCGNNQLPFLSIYPSIELQLWHSTIKNPRIGQPIEVVCFYIRSRGIVPPVRSMHKAEHTEHMFTHYWNGRYIVTVIASIVKRRQAEEEEAKKCKKKTNQICNRSYQCQISIPSTWKRCNRICLTLISQKFCCYHSAMKSCENMQNRKPYLCGKIFDYLFDLA